MRLHGYELYGFKTIRVWNGPFMVIHTLGRSGQGGNMEKQTLGEIAAQKLLGMIDRKSVV